jgi:leucyl aminopeptidase
MAKNSKKKLNSLSHLNHKTSHPGAQAMMTNPLDIEISSSLRLMQVGGRASSESSGFIFVLGRENKDKFNHLIEERAPQFQKSQLKKSLREVVHFVSDRGPVWILSPRRREAPVSHGGQLEDSAYSWMRDQAGSLVSLVKAYHMETLQIELHSTSEEQELGLFVGLEVAGYNYKSLIDEQGLGDFPRIHLRKAGGVLFKGIDEKGRILGSAINLARHLVNTPPNFMNPKTMADFVRKKFSRMKNLTVDIWDEKKLEKEGMHLHRAVGQGALHPPCLIHLQYRPQKRNGHRGRPIAFVGKGITFDTGGLDIKPSSGMRLMKKDMGGAAAVLGLAQWAVESDYPRPLDFYLAMAENSISARSFRPSDVLTARNGLKVEIHNTDAEGRLVLADALDVAVSRSGYDEPEMVINVATLTGAIKVALGAEIAGLFSNDDSLAESLVRAGQSAGDLNWRMPLFSRYTSPMSSTFADFVNATDGFGGAITAALFLEKFVRQKPWAHLDVYAWNDKATGPLAFAGGSGQPVQCLVHFLLNRL